MAARFQPFPNPANQDLSYNLPTDPRSYPVFTSFDEREEHIRQVLENNYHNQVDRQVTDEMDADVGLVPWINSQVTAWNRRNNFRDIEWHLDVQTEPSDDESSEQPTEMNSDINHTHRANADPREIREAPHLPMPPISSITGRSIYYQPAPRSRASDDLSSGSHRERSKSPSRKSPSLGRRGDFPERILERGRRADSPASSAGRRATREEFLEVDGLRRSRSNSLQQSGSPERGATSQSDSRESSPSGRGATIWSWRSSLWISPIDIGLNFLEGSPLQGRPAWYAPNFPEENRRRGWRSRSQSDSPERSRTLIRSISPHQSGIAGRDSTSSSDSSERNPRRSNSPQRSDSPGRGPRSSSDFPERSSRRSRSNSPQRSGTSRRGPRSSSDSPERSSQRSRYNSPQRSCSPRSGARSSSDSQERSSRRSRSNSPQGSRSSGSEGRSSSDSWERTRSESDSSERRFVGSTSNFPQGTASPPRSPVPLSQEDEDELKRVAYNIELRAERERRLAPLLRRLYIAFVGDQELPPVQDGFDPCRGDLIISHPDSRHIGLPNSVGYIASYLGHYKFTPRDLVLRVGNFDVDSPSGLFPGIVSYKPFTSLQLYAYHYGAFSSWKFLGNQAELHNGIFIDPPDVSPGKFLRVGTPVLGPSSNFVEALVPRRGDVIIKREVWVEDFSHAEDFWYSMVKWHRGRQFSFLAGDMLVRRLVDSNYARNNWGWAELYLYEGTSVGWVFLGRTQHVYDTPWPERKPYIVLYEYDDGADSDDEIQKERVNPR